MTVSPSREDLTLPPLADRMNRRDRVIHALRAAIVTGQMRPGQVYSAPALAAQFGVSPTPVREAMVELATHGLVVVVPNKGFRVRELSDAELDQITEIRLLLEVPTVTAAVGRIGPDRLVRLRRIARELVRLAQDGDVAGYVEQDRDFHLDLLAVHGNTELVELVGRLRSRSRLYGLVSLARSGEILDTAKEHVELLDLIETGNRQGVTDLMRRHIGHVRGSWAGRSAVPGPAADS